jgi:NAD(P)-dependent dehydrogenase (short-subunit alcohol dehydrogenase family)
LGAQLLFDVLRRYPETAKVGCHVVQITTSLVDYAMSTVPSVLASLTKGALSAATKSLAIEYAKRGIRVTAGSSARPLLPADGEGDEAAISCGAWDKYGGVEHRRPHQNDEPVFAASDLRSRPRAPSRRANDQRHRAADGVRPAHDRQMDPD